jgi:DNA-binding response OmpR family regulator
MAIETPGRPRLLIAEDDAALAETMREVLEEDFAVNVTGDGSAAVRQARTDRPDVLVIDARLPQMDGFEACRALRRDPVTANLPIIMVTGDSAPGLVHAAFEAGATDYMQKPFSISQLRARATTCLMRRRAS